MGSVIISINIKKKTAINGIKKARITKKEAVIRRKKKTRLIKKETKVDLIK